MASVRALHRALAIDSLNAVAWGGLAFALDEARDPDGALHAYRRQLVLSPGSRGLLTNLSLHFYWQRQYDSAAAWADSAIAADPAYIGARRVAGSVALTGGRLDEAAVQFEAGVNVGPGPERVWSLAGLAAVAAARGDSASARALLPQMEAITDSAAPSVHGAVYIAWAYTAVGQFGRALDWLERYRPARDLHFQLHIARDPPLDRLRGEPRFRALLAQQ